MNVQRSLPLAGIVFVAITAIAVAAIGSGSPGPDASASKVAAFYDAHHARQLAVAFALAVAVPFFICFIAALAIAARPPEAGVRSAWGLVLVSGGVLAAGAILLTAAVHFAVADSADDLAPSALQTLNVLDGDTWVALNAGVGVMMLGAAGSLLAGATGKRWLGWTALVLGIALFIPFADFFALLASGVWIVIASVSLMRHQGGWAAGGSAVQALEQGAVAQP